MSVNMTAVHNALRTQLLTVAGLPAARAWENKDFTPTAGQVYVEEALVPGGRSLTGQARAGFVDTDGIYVVKWYGLANTGTTVSDGAETVLAAFPPGTSLPATDGTYVRIGSDNAPKRGPVRPADAGRAVCVIEVPFQCVTSSP